MNPLQLLISWFHAPLLEDVRRSFTAMFITIDLILIGVFGLFAYAHYKDAPYKQNSALQAALSLGTYFLGRLILQIYGWLGPEITNSGTYTVTFGWNWGIVLPLVGSTITVIGAAWAALAFTPVAWRFKGWGLAVISVSLFLALTWKL